MTWVLSCGRAQAGAQMAQVAFQRQLQAQMQAQMRQQQAALQAQLRAAQAQAQAAALQAQQYQRAASLVSLPWPTPPRFGWPAQRGRPRCWGGMRHRVRVWAGAVSGGARVCDAGTGQGGGGARSAAARGGGGAQGGRARGRHAARCGRAPGALLRCRGPPLRDCASLMCGLVCGRQLKKYLVLSMWASL